MKIKGILIIIIFAAAVAGPSLNILIKLMTVVGLVFLPWFV